MTADGRFSDWGSGLPPREAEGAGVSRVGAGTADRRV